MKTTKLFSIALILGSVFLGPSLSAQEKMMKKQEKMMKQETKMVGGAEMYPTKKHCGKCCQL